MSVKIEVVKRRTAEEKAQVHVSFGARDTALDPARDYTHVELKVYTYDRVLELRAQLWVQLEQLGAEVKTAEERRATACAAGCDSETIGELDRARAAVHQRADKIMRRYSAADFSLLSHLGLR